MAKVSGVRKAQDRIRALSGRETVERVGKALFAGGELIKGHAQRSITEGSISGANHVPSKPGEPPNEDTGTLRRGIVVNQIGPLRVRVSSTAPYSAFLEFGTSRMLARPFMGPAARAKRDEVIDLVRSQVDIAIKRG